MKPVTSLSLAERRAYGDMLRARGYAEDAFCVLGFAALHCPCCIRRVRRIQEAEATARNLLENGRRRY